MNDSAIPSGGLKGTQLLLAGLFLALTNFMVVLDTTIANVSVPHIAGSLGISPSQGTWIITSYAVAEAICVPLTGWLAGRFGAVRTFIMCVIGFGIFSALCGLSNSLGMLVACRIGQGLCGGPLMPLSQTLIMRIFPPHQQAQAMGIWGMTTVVAPILGPILGGTISDNWTWHWIFFINIPVAIFCAIGVKRLLANAETETNKLRVDRIGLVMMVLWIGALQLMLDLGREHDWFSDPLIVGLALFALIGCVVFLIWEAHEGNPIVDLRIFRHRGFSVAVASLACGFGTFFAITVIIPQWLQSSMGYTATYAGYTTAFIGVAAVAMAPVAASLSNRYDPRLLVTFGLLWLAFTSWMRSHWTSDADFWTLAFPQLLQGFGMPFFFFPLTTLALSAVEPHETASAAGVMNFLRTMAGAVGTSISMTLWEDNARVARNEIVGGLNTEPTVDTLAGSGFSLEQARLLVEHAVDKEALLLASTHIFLLAAVLFVLSASIIWLAPRPARIVAGGGGH